MDSLLYKRQWHRHTAVLPYNFLKSAPPKTQNKRMEDMRSDRPKLFLRLKFSGHAKLPHNFYCYHVHSSARANSRDCRAKCEERRQNLCNLWRLPRWSCLKPTVALLQRLQKHLHRSATTATPNACGWTANNPLETKRLQRQLRHICTNTPVSFFRYNYKHLYKSTYEFRSMNCKQLYRASCEFLFLKLQISIQIILSVSFYITSIIHLYKSTRKRFSF